MSSVDLRDWLAAVEQIGELRQAPGANPELEIGAITEMVHRRPDAPAILFTAIPGAETTGYRILTNSTGSLNRLALACNLPPGLTLAQFKQQWQAKQALLQPVEPVVVSDGPVMSNIMRGDDVNLNLFPAPRWHEYDGGRYLGTGSVDITRDPDSGQVNMGTYRVMQVDENHVTFYVSPGKDGYIHREKYFDRNQPCPIAISLGHHPVVFLVGSVKTPAGFDEYQYAGALAGQPLAVITGPVTGLPLPATAEIVLEGYASPTERHPEGVFGEWTGYYASGQRLEPLVTVEAVYFRDQPIMLGSPPCKPPYENIWSQRILRALELEAALGKAGIPDVTGVWFHECGGSHLMTVVAIRQRYAGHSRQAAMAASAISEGAYMGRYVVVVDDDIDHTDLNDVMWAVCTRSDPERSIDIVRRCWSGPLDPALPPQQKWFNSRALIDACKPWEWKDQFPRVAECSLQLMAQTRARWEARLLG